MTSLSWRTQWKARLSRKPFTAGDIDGIALVRILESLRETVRHTLAALLFIALFSITSADEVPYPPSPVAIELHPPFSGRYWRVAASQTGDIFVAAENHIGIFDGLRWRHIATPDNTARSFLERGGRIWVGGTGQIGWISNSSDDNTYHLALTGLSGEVLDFFDSGPNFVAVSADAIILLDGVGKIVEKYKISFQGIRHIFRYGDGVILKSSKDAFYIDPGSGFKVSESPIPQAFLSQIRAVSFLQISGKTYLFGGRASYEISNHAFSKLDSPFWADLDSEHLIEVLRPEHWSSFIRIGSEQGIKGFDLDTLSPLWKLRVGEELDGDVPSYSASTSRGLFFATTAKVYWVPSDMGARRLTGMHQRSNTPTGTEHGLWISTSEGSWEVPRSSWNATDAVGGSTWETTELSSGVLRGQMNGFHISGRLIQTTGVGGYAHAIGEFDGGIYLAHALHVYWMDPDFKVLASTVQPNGATSFAVANDGVVYCGTSTGDVERWNRTGTFTLVRKREGVTANVEFRKPNECIVLWADGLLEIGNKTVQLPNPTEAHWICVKADRESILVAGRSGERPILDLLRKNSRDEWTIQPLDHPALDSVGNFDSIALSGDEICVSGSGGCYEFALSFLTGEGPTPTPTVAMVHATVSSRGAVSTRVVAPSQSDVELHSDEDELTFSLKGGREYWNQRVQFRYRLRPDSAEWTPLDVANATTLQRIGVGEHILDVEARSPRGVASSLFRIVRPPYWYASRWAYAAYIASCVGMALGMVTLRTRRLKERARVLEERVAARTAELKRANETKDEFLASVSHEIRNPLNGVIGLSTMLRETAEKERDRRLADSLHACADQLRLVLDDVLDFSRIERGEIELHATAFDVGAAVRAAAMAVDPSLRRTRISIDPGCAVQWLRGDEGKIRQIVSNLVSNAHKYGVPPEAEIQVAYREGRLEIAVSNTGPDIAPEDQTRIFGSFERGRTIAHKYVSGVGLGLTISSRFAQAMGGTLSIKSAEGLTCFTFSAPMDTAERPAPSVANVAAPRRGRALAVEDESYNRLVLGHVLAQLGYDADWAQNGAEALEIFRAGARYDVIFTDWMLPDMTGGELVRKLRDVGGRTTPPIIAVTAYATAEKRAEAFAAGVAAFVTKPITMEKIVGSLPNHATNPVAADEAVTPSRESLRFGIFVDTADPQARIADFKVQLQRRMDAIDLAWREGDRESAARTAHQLASQVLSIHHHTFADQLRAFESAVAEKQREKAEALLALNRVAAAELITSLDSLTKHVATHPMQPNDPGAHHS